MERRPFALIALLLSIAIASSSVLAEQPKYPPHTLANTELRVLPQAPNGRAYQLHIALPPSYASQPHRRYPVLFVTDGYWDFATVQSSYNNLLYDKVVPECLIVGLGYAGDNLPYNDLRRWELSPVVQRDANATGHAREFLDYLEQQIIPFVEREYRADPQHRVLAGSSLGGLFALYTMFSKPHLFQGYIAASPAAIVGNEWLLTYEEAFAKSNKDLRARLYVTGAQNEWPDFLAAIERFDRRIKTRKYPQLAYEYRQIDGERHAGTKAESYVRGMRFVYLPLAPESGPMGNMR